LEHSESSADTASSLADPNGFRYGAATANESELTIPRASLAPFELPPESPTNWHVHLELRPEELVALHRLGLTKGAIAWREGMPAWQPLRESNDNMQLGSEVLARAMESLQETAELASSGEPPGPRESWSDAITIAADRGSEPANDAQELLPPIDVDTAMHILPPRVRRATLPPTSPLFAAGGRPHVVPVSAPPRTGNSVSTLPPSGTRGAVAALALPSAPRLPSFAADAPAPGFAAPALASAPPPATVFEPSIVTQPGPSRRMLWLGAIGLAAASAFVGALLSGTFKNENSESAAAEPREAPEQARTGSTPEATAKPTGVSPISIEQLPLAGAAAPAQESNPARVAAASSPSKENDRERTSRDREGDTERESARAAAPEPAAPEPAEPPSAGKRAIMAAMAQAVSSPAPAAEPSKPAPESSEPEPSRATEGADLKAISRAVGNAARSATSCGDSPQSGRVAITFSPSGAVRSVQMEEPFAERDVGACVLRAMGRAKVGAFTGDPVTVRKAVSW
jgi:hypothetical protein